MTFDEFLIEKYGTTNATDLMNKLGIKFQSDKYIWQGHPYDDYKEAMAVASGYEGGELAVPEEHVFMSTTPSIDGYEIEQTLGLVSADCAYGMNVFRDLFAGIRDFVGGRSGAVENVLRDAKNEVMFEMSRQAKSKGGNAIVGIDFDFNELDGGGKSGMLLVSGTGTAVKVKDFTRKD